jgi:hypothetical protein
MKKDPIQDYQIDPRLKAGKDYPSELELLFEKFKSRKMGLLQTNSKEKIRSYQRQIELVEKTFKEYFLITATITGIEKITPGKIERISEPQELEKEAKRVKNFDPIHRNAVRRVNARLKYFTPQLWPRADFGYRLEPFFLDNKKDPFGEVLLWAWLSLAIAELDPELVRECAYCGKIFISRQRKKYHPECQRRFFSEKAVLEGIARKRQKDYRERKKEK